MGQKSSIFAAIAMMTLAPAAAQYEEFRGAYEQNKQSAAGMTPSTRSEMSLCMASWGYMGLAAMEDTAELRKIHPDFNADMIDSHYSHWWAAAEAVYGADRLDKLAQDVKQHGDNYDAMDNIGPIFATVGACFIPDDKRTGPRRMAIADVYQLSESAAPPLSVFQQYAGGTVTVAAGGPLLPGVDMLENIVDGTIDGTKTKRFKGLQKVLVPHFAVSFALADQLQTSTQSRNVYGSGSGVSMSAEILGLTEPLLQAITDKAYEDFLRQMAAHGYDVISGPEAQKQLFHREFYRTKVYDEPVRDMSVYHNAFNGNFKDITFSPTGMSLINPLWEVSMAAKELDVPALNVQYSVHFAWFDAESSYDRRAFSGNETMSSSMSFNLGVQVIYSSGIEIMRDTAGNPKLSVEGTFYSRGDFVSAADSDSNGGGSRKRRAYKIQANGDAYYKEAVKTISRTNTALISQMAALR